MQEGDEIINVNGRRLRGVTLEAARNILKHTPREVDIVVAREPLGASNQSYDSMCSNLIEKEEQAATSSCHSEHYLHSQVDSLDEELPVDLNCLLVKQNYSRDMLHCWREYHHNWDNGNDDRDSLGLDKGILWEECHCPQDQLKQKILKEQNRDPRPPRDMQCLGDNGDNCGYINNDNHPETENGLVTAVMVRTISESSSGI